MGLLQISQPNKLFSGFANPALFTVAAVLVMSVGIVESGILNGLGKSIAKRVHQPKQQIFTLSIATGLMSAFMNNIGAIGLILPTARRMAFRAGTDKAIYGLPLVYASILGGSITLIGTASNIIVSAFRLQAFGEPFKMFDFATHGLAMAGTGILLWFICRLCGYDPMKQQKDETNRETSSEEKPVDHPTQPAPQRSKKNTIIVLGSIIPAIVLTSWGLVHPSIGFGFVVLVLIGTGILHHEKAYKAINIPVVIFLGSMLSLANILQETGALPLVISKIIPVVQDLPTFLLILIFILTTAILANILDNSVSAVLMAPTAIILYQSGFVEVSADALLMAVAAGSSLGIVLPTHQVTLVTMTTMNFSRHSFIRTGAVIAFFAIIAAASVITVVWS